MAWEDALKPGPGPAPRPAAAIDSDLAAILYTSSTTGRAKGVMLSHANMTAAAASVTAYLENTEQDILLNVLPMSFSYGLYQVLTAFQVGATVVLERPFLYPYPVIDTLVRERVTGFPLVPAIAALLLQLKDLSKYDFSSVRYVTSAAQAITPRQISGLQALFPGARFFSMYGQTECKRATYLPPEEVARRPASVGKAIPNTEVYLVDEAGRRITAPNTVGELVVRGPHVMQGYWNLPEETARRLKPGFPPWEKHLYTGDLFKMDEEEFLYFVARKDDLIKTGGELVSPKEVEDVLYELPDVSEAAVKGRPDEILGQTVAAFVVLQEGSKVCEGDILAFCRERLEGHKMPRAVRILPGFPKTPSGKISKLDL
jgi:acyl-CoA synthetase (AMP-forming)/AMP-acid ligase II